MVGSGGEALRRLQQQFEEVRVSVPPPEDKETRHITLEGPKEQVAAAAALLTQRVEEEEQRVREWRAKLARDARVARHPSNTPTPKGGGATLAR